MKRRMIRVLATVLLPLTSLASLCCSFAAVARTHPNLVYERMVEWTMESKRQYKNPFDEVEVDVVFTNGKESWRVPAFWRGGQRWTVRFAPPCVGELSYRVESSDRTDRDLNSMEGTVRVAPYSGPNQLLKRGAFRTSKNGRYFEQVDGTPFFWLGDTWWSGLSSRLTWPGFKELSADRAAKGFTVVQLVAGLVPGEDVGLSAPGARNEGGQVWEDNFARINPVYFDYADRRIQHLIDSGLAPAIVGAWGIVGWLDEMGPKKMKQHWRYLIGRYGAYPVFWILGGEVIDPPTEIATNYPVWGKSILTPGWTEIARYVRSIDPYHHPMTVHEIPPPLDTALKDESLMDFDMFQSGHFGWASLATEVAQLNFHYARTRLTKPLVEGEIGYERLGEAHFEDFQRSAFWLSMLNGAAGHTYGANGTWQAITGEMPLQQQRHTFMTWREGMILPGSYQIGIGAKLLRQYPWWQFTPRPEWVASGGTTLLEPNGKISGFDIEPWQALFEPFCKPDCLTVLNETWPGGAWKAKGGTIRGPYAAGIPGKIRIIYVPGSGTSVANEPPTILGLEPGTRYSAYFWEPSTGTKFELADVERPIRGDVLISSKNHEQMSAEGRRVSYNPSNDTVRVDHLADENLVATVTKLDAEAESRMLLRLNGNSYIAATYSAQENELYISEVTEGTVGRKLGQVPIRNVNQLISMTVELQDDKAIASLTDGKQTFTTPIVNVTIKGSGSVVLPFVKQNDGTFEVRRGGRIVHQTKIPGRSLYDAQGNHRGDLQGNDIQWRGRTIPGWGNFGQKSNILLDAYRPERLPSTGDWLLVLDAIEIK